MATPMTSEQYARAILPIIRREWDDQFKVVSSGLESLFGVERSSSAVEYSQGYGDGGIIPEYNAAGAEDEPGSIQYDSFDTLFEKTFTHKEYAKGMAIERKLFDDDRAGVIRRRAQTFGKLFADTVAYHQAAVFNSAFSTVLGGDGVVLCSASHPYSPSNSSTFSNAGSSALSYAALIATIQAGALFKSDKGVPQPSMFDRLIVPIGLQATAYELVNAIAKPGTANNDANALKDRELQVLVSPWLTDTDNWFMADSQLAPMHNLWFWRVNPEVDLDPASNFNLVAKYRGYMRFSYGWDDPRWIYGHSV